MNYMKDYKLIVIQADEQRIGQKMSNFLDWLKEKGTDPFYISNNKLIKYWKEYDYKTIQ